MSFLWPNNEGHIDHEVAQRKAIDNLGLSKMDVWRAVGREALLDNPEALLANIATIHYQEHFNQEKLSPEQFNQKYSDSGLEYDPNMTEELAQYLLARKKQHDINSYIIARGKGGMLEAAGSFGSAVLASFASPSNIALSLVPIGGQLRWAKFGAKYGELAAAGAKGAVSSGTFQAGLEPLISYSRHLEQRDYGLAESLANIGIAASFGALVNSLGYGFSKFKGSFIDHNLQVKAPYNTGHSAVDQELKGQIDELSSATSPNSLSPSIASSSLTIEELQAQKLDLFTQTKHKIPDLFDQLEREAKLKSDIGKIYHTDQPQYIPEYLRQLLKQEQEKTTSIEQKYLNDPHYLNYLETKKQIDDKINQTLKQQQHRAKAYDLSPEDLYIASQQLEDGKHIDLADPNYARSIYETGANYEKAPNPEIGQNSANDIFENAKNFINGHQSRKVGFKELLRQTELRQQTIARELLCGLTSDLEKQQLSQFFTNKNFHADIAKELHNLSANQYPHGYSGSKIALEIAKIISHWQTVAINRANRAGAEIEQLEGYITRQMHAPKALKNMGYEKWYSFILPLLDLEKTGEIEFKAVFEALATGVHFDQDSLYLRGTSNLAKAISQSRKLHFKSAEHWLQYNEQCGKYNLSDSILLNLENLGQNTGMLEMFGTNPQDNFIKLKAAMIQALREGAASSSKNAIAELQYFQSNKADNIFDLLTGKNRPENPNLAAISSSLRTLKNLSSLGSTLISSLPDIASWVGELAGNGVPILTGYRHLLTDLLSSFTSKDRREFAKLLGIASETSLGLAYSRLNAEYPALGHLSKLSNLFFKLNCMDWWDSSFKSTMGLILSRNLAEYAGSDFTKLPKLLQQNLERYNIDHSNWHLYKYFKQELGQDHYIIPNAEIPDAPIIKHLNELKIPVTQETIAKTKDDLSNNLRRYYLDRVDTAIATPHTAEIATIFAGTKSGSWLGEFVRFFMQFKSFPISYIMRPLQAATLDRVPKIQQTGMLSHDMLAALQNPGTITAMTHLLLGSSVLGYLSICAKKLLQNEEMPDPSDPRIWTASVIKGGGLGIFGDFIFNEYDRYGRTFLQEAAGPVFGDINSIASILSKYKQGEISKAEDEAFKLMLNNVPFRNLFYLQPAIRMMQKP